MMDSNIIKLRFDSRDKRSSYLPPEKIHNLPCRIDYNGKADVSKYFDVYIKKSVDKPEMTGTFRGHPVTAKVTDVPENYVGVLMKSTKNKSEDASEKICVGTFKNLTYWNWSSTKPKLDNLEDTYKLLDYTSAIHGIKN